MDLPRSLRVSRDGEEPRYVVTVDVSDGPARKAAGAVILASPPQQETITPQAAA